MGAVFRPKDLTRSHRKIIDDAIKDFTPETKDNAIKVLDSWKGKVSEEELKNILGKDKAEELMKNIESKRKE
jgi:predicted CopG family antitoxin